MRKSLDAMQLQAVDKVDSICPEEFRDRYYNPMRPLVIKGLSKQWQAYEKWGWDYFKSVVGEVNIARQKTFPEEQSQDDRQQRQRLKRI